MTVTVVVAVVLIILFLCYKEQAHSYWAKKNVPYIEVASIFGNAYNLLSRKHGISYYVKKAYEEFKKRGCKHGGIYIFTKPIYVPVDTELIKNIMGKDFSHFPGHGMSVDEKREPLRLNLINLEGEKWKYMRTKLTPTFTSGKMKRMFQALLDCSVPMTDYVDDLCKKNVSLDIKEILACYTTDVIVACVFGLDHNCFTDPNDKFRDSGRKILESTVWKAIQRFIGFSFPTVNRFVPIKVITKDVENFFLNIVESTIDYRKSAGIKRNDFIHLLMEMEEKAKTAGDKVLTLKEVTAQALIFFLGGFETSSTLMTFCLHELAFNQDIQDSLREEIQEAYKANNGVLTYDAVMKMKYLDQVINETLRKYPPIPSIPRKCSVDYEVPGTDVIIEKGTSVFISILGLHRDEEYYPNPEKFDPERFSEENKMKRSAFSFLPFGEGPRVCIAMRFGLMQAKTGLCILLNNYKFSPPMNEPYKFEFDPWAGVLTKNGTIKLNAENLPS